MRVSGPTGRQMEHLYPLWLFRGKTVHHQPSQRPSHPPSTSNFVIKSRKRAGVVQLLFTFSFKVQNRNVLI